MALFAFALFILQATGQTDPGYPGPKNTVPGCNAYGEPLNGVTYYVNPNDNYNMAAYYQSFNGCAANSYARVTISKTDVISTPDALNGHFCGYVPLDGVKHLIQCPSFIRGSMADGQYAFYIDFNTQIYYILANWTHTQVTTTSTPPAVTSTLTPTSTSTTTSVLHTTETSTFPQDTVTVPADTATNTFTPPPSTATITATNTRTKTLTRKDRTDITITKKAKCTKAAHTAQPGLRVPPAKRNTPTLRERKPEVDEFGPEPAILEPRDVNPGIVYGDGPLTATVIVGRPTITSTAPATYETEVKFSTETATTTIDPDPLTTTIYSGTATTDTTLNAETVTVTNNVITRTSITTKTSYTKTHTTTKTPTCKSKSR